MNIVLLLGIKKFNLCEQKKKEKIGTCFYIRECLILLIRQILRWNVLMMLMMMLINDNANNDMNTEH